MGGFTLIELLVVVAIIGVIASIAVSNLINAVDRGKQKRTMADLRAVATAIEAYSIDNSTYPTAADAQALQTSLETRYIRHLPVVDGWNHSFFVSSATAGYTVGSEGKDGAGGLTACASAPTCEDFDDAIVFVDGQFVQWPEGQQR